MAFSSAFSPIASTYSREDTELILSQELVDTRILKLDPGPSAHMVMKRAQVGDVTMSDIHFGVDYELSSGEIESDFVLVLGTAGMTSVGADECVLDRDIAVISSGGRISHMRTPSSRETVLKIPRNSVRRRLQLALDRTLSRELEFANRVLLDSSAGSHLRSTLSYVIAGLEQDSDLLQNPLIAANFEDLLLGALLSLPSNYSDEILTGHDKKIAPEAVRRAEEFIEANACHPISTADILVQAGCGEKALFSNFRKYRGYSPNQFLNDVRLRQAHDMLCKASQPGSVTSIAYAAGFSHMGRFSDIYKKRYGVKPSDTLKRAISDR